MLHNGDENNFVEDAKAIANKNNIEISNNEWSILCAKITDEIGDVAYKNWIMPLQYSKFENGKLEILAPTKFMANWVSAHYSDLIRSIWASLSGNVEYLDIQVSDKIKADNIKTKSTKTDSSAPKKMDDLTSRLNPKFTFQNFIVGKPNELAYAAAKKVVENSKKVTFNPLFFHGGVGLGKTHLMHSIAWAIKEQNPDRNVVYLSAEKFMYQFIQALRYKDTMAFKEMFRSVDVLMIDDVQFISSKNATQEEFFHTFNALVDQNRQIIISADKSPSDLDGIEERLRSRLGCGLVADLHPTTFELRLGILEAKRDELEVDIPKEVLEFLSHKVTSNIRELEGALNRVAAHADLIGHRITIETTKDVLRDLLRSNQKYITIDDIQKKVAEHYNIRIADMHSAKRSRNVARPRQVAMYLSKKLTSSSLPEIGRKFGGRDHTTVMHAVKKINELIVTDRELMENITVLTRAIS